MRNMRLIGGSPNEEVMTPAFGVSMSQTNSTDKDTNNSARKIYFDANTEKLELE